MIVTDEMIEGAIALHKKEKRPEWAYKPQTPKQFSFLSDYVVTERLMKIDRGGAASLIRIIKECRLLGVEDEAAIGA